MGFIVNLFGSLFGFFMNLLFSLTNSYAMSVLLIVLIVRCIVFPIKRGLAKVKKKPKGERDIKTTVLRILKTVFSVISFFILIGLYGAVASPVTNILKFDSETVTSLMQVLTENGLTRVNELSILNNLGEFKEAFSYIVSPEQLEILEEFKLHFRLGSIDLTQVPKVTNISIVIPIISTVLTIFPFVMQLRGVKGKVKLPTPIKLYFLLIMLLSCFLAYVLPAGVGYYLCLSKIIGLIETHLTKWLDKRSEPVQSETQATASSEAVVNKAETSK